MSKPLRLCVIQGSLGGARGNTQRLVRRWVQEWNRQAGPSAPVDLHVLADEKWKSPRGWRALRKSIDEADALVFATGTFWDSWGSPLQSFVERATLWEGNSLWLGKPAAVLVTMHSVGGKSVLSRLQGVLITLGLGIPPMSGLAYSLAGQIALSAGSAHADFWSENDLSVIAENLRIAALSEKQNGSSWRAWPVDSGDPARRWVSLPPAASRSKRSTRAPGAKR